MSESLHDLLEKLGHIDDDLPPEEFDPAQVVGDIKDKVDAIKWRIDSWLTEAENIEQNWIKPLKDKKESLTKKADRLRQYMQTEMIQNGYEKLPGNMFSARLQKSSPAVDVAEEAGPHHLIAYPEFVVQQINYRWNKEAIKEKLDQGAELSFAKLRNSRHLRFYTNKKEQN